MKSRITGTSPAAAPAFWVTRSISSAVSSCTVRPVMVAFSTALRSFRSASVTWRGSLISLFFTTSPLVITTRMKLPASAIRISNRFTVAAP